MSDNFKHIFSASFEAIGSLIINKKNRMTLNFI